MVAGRRKGSFERYTKVACSVDWNKNAEMKKRKDQQAANAQSNLRIFFQPIRHFFIIYIIYKIQMEA